MNFKNFSDGQLVTKLKSLVAEERKIITEILHFLREADTRRLYARWGHPSLFEFCTKELGYSAGAAQRRIESMRLLKSLGESEVRKIEDGKVNLTQLSMLQTFVRNKEKQEQQKIKPEEKFSWLTKMADKPTRECEKILQTIDPTVPMFPKEKERVIAEGRTELKFSVSDQLMKKIERIKELRAHANPKMTYEEMLEYLAEVALDKIDPERRIKRLEAKTQMRTTKVLPPMTDLNAENKNKTKTVNSLPAPENKPAYAPSKNPDLTTQEKNTAAPEKQHKQTQVSLSSQLQPKQAPASRAIPANIKQKVWLRDQGRCTYQSLENGKVCGSRFGLEFEHTQPFSFGGPHTESNITLHCKAHNLAQAFNKFGEEKMNSYLK